MIYKDYTKVSGDMFSEFIVNGALNLKSHLEEINDLNVFPIPDGDTGDNMYRTINGGIEKMLQCESKTISDKSKALAEGMLFNARGNSGVILSQLFAGFADGFNGLDEANIDQLCKAFKQGSKRAYSAVITPVEGTILTVARECIEIPNAQMEDIKNLGDFGEVLIKRMHDSLDRRNNIGQFELITLANTVSIFIDGVYNRLKNLDNINDDFKPRIQVLESILTPLQEDMLIHQTQMDKVMSEEFPYINNQVDNAVLDYTESIRIIKNLIDQSDRELMDFKLSTSTSVDALRSGLDTVKNDINKINNILGSADNLDETIEDLNYLKSGLDDNIKFLFQNL